MTISSQVKNELFENSDQQHERLIRIDRHLPASERRVSPCGPAWTEEEHNRFLQGLELYPSGPWKTVAAYVGTKTARQTMTHAQRYREKIARRKRGLKINIVDKNGVPVSDSRTPKTRVADAEEISFCFGQSDTHMLNSITPEEQAEVDRFFAQCEAIGFDLDLLEDYESLELEGDLSLTEQADDISC